MSPARLRILVVPEWYPSPENPVLGVFVRDQALAVAAAHDVTVLVHDARPSAGRRSSIARGDEGGLRTIRIRTPGVHGTAPARALFLAAAARELDRMRRTGEEPDVIHAHVYLAGLPAVLLARGGLPVIVSEHHSDFVEGKVGGRAASIARFVLRRATLVCPVSDLLRDHLAAFEPTGRYETVPNVVDVGAFAGHPRGEPRAGGVTRLLVVALLAPQKGMDHLVDALARLGRTRSDVVLDIVGDGPSRAEIEAHAGRVLAPGVVTFHGARSRAEVAGFMARSDIFLLPSTVETFGVVAIEALAAGLPVVTTSAVGVHRVIGDRFGAVVAPGDAGALCAALEAMIDDPPPFHADAAAAEARRYGAAAVGRRWDEIYRAVARRR